MCVRADLDDVLPRLGSAVRASLRLNTTGSAICYTDGCCYVVTEENESFDRVLPNIGRKLILERCVHRVTEQFQSRIGPEGNGALHNLPLLVVHDNLEA